MRLRTKTWDHKNGRFDTTEMGDFGLIEIEDDHGNVIQVDTPNDPERPGLVIFSPFGELVLPMKADGKFPRPELVGTRVVQMQPGEPGPDGEPSGGVHIASVMSAEQLVAAAREQKFPCPRCGEVAVKVEVGEDGVFRSVACEKCCTKLQATLVTADDAQGAVEMVRERQNEDSDE